MIRTSASLKAGLIVVSAIAHLTVAYVVFSEPQVQIAGGADVVIEARLGNSFEDLAAGAEQSQVSETSPAEPVETERPEPPIETQPAKPEATETPITPTKTAAVALEQIQRAEVDNGESATLNETVQQTKDSTRPREPIAQIESSRPAVTTPLPALSIETIATEAAIPTTAPTDLIETTEVEETANVEPDVVAAVQPRTEPENITPVSPASPPKTLQPTPEAPQAAAPAPEILSPNADRAVNVSPRPEKRPVRETHETRSEQSRPTQQGNSDRNATTGSATGSQAGANPRQSNNTGQSTASGNAAVSNYPGQVMRKISRVRKPRVGSRGTATIRFSINASGGLTSIAVSRSSGSTRLDRAALEVIEKAVPFPKPPPGAQRNFSIQIQGRG